MAQFPHITSSQNSKVSLLRSLHTTKGRAQEHLWFVEGPHLVREALRAFFRPKLIVFDAEALAGNPLVDEFEDLEGLGVEIATTTPAIMEKIAETLTPQGIVAAFSVVDVVPHQLRSKRQFRDRPITLILDDLRDPGNVGTILRSALAADVNAVYLTPQCVDVFAPKVVRAASGAHFHLPVYPNQHWDNISYYLREEIDVQEILVADSGVSDNYMTVDFTVPIGLIIGNEAHGPSIQARKLANRSITIPMYNGVESLNAAIATSIILFESARQRKSNRSTVADSGLTADTE